MAMPLDRGESGFKAKQETRLARGIATRLPSWTWHNPSANRLKSIEMETST
ncbi:hypothetical protein RFM68_30295 [Mesorhizobium sp. MSK_1335]|uniref:Uncharacterized protein n=1 Tax=Mesorhizobium montanum TaxID=3072323 RepID=A0ABU4ZTN0_9HYPH|nr:hypothetical protein [Mesorhizobium sp. MSK_1335]MDX8528769.1 hypothetical protein [Mesorhizobium sp. MSK_1335]